jgi:hypothetical protein
MLTMQLNVKETEVLTEALTSYLSELRMEIADTDSKDFRDHLKGNEEILNQVVQMLKA